LGHKVAHGAEVVRKGVELSREAEDGREAREGIAGGYGAIQNGGEILRQFVPRRITDK